MLLDELAAQKKGDHQGNLDFIKKFSDVVSLCAEIVLRSRLLDCSRVDIPKASDQLYLKIV